MHGERESLFISKCRRHKRNDRALHLSSCSHHLAPTIGPGRVSVVVVHGWAPLAPRSVRTPRFMERRRSQQQPIRVLHHACRPSVISRHRHHTASATAAASAAAAPATPPPSPRRPLVRRRYEQLMVAVGELIDAPGERDVPVRSVFTQPMFEKLKASMAAQGWAGIDAVEEVWESDLASRPIVSGFLKDKEIGAKRLASMPDRFTNTINTEDGRTVCRPTVINNYDVPMPDGDAWFAQWHAFFFEAPLLVKARTPPRRLKDTHDISPPSPTQFRLCQDLQHTSETPDRCSSRPSRAPRRRACRAPCSRRSSAPSTAAPSTLWRTPRALQSALQHSRALWRTPRGRTANETTFTARAVSRYPALSEAEEAISLPLQLLCLAIFDAILAGPLDTS